MKHHHINIINRRDFLSTVGKAGMMAALASVTNVPGVLKRALAEGTIGSGKQGFSWIHETDFARALEFILQKQMTGVVNIVSPTPTSNQVFMNTLCKTLKVPFGFPISKMMLEFGAKIIGTETELVLKSRNVVPKRLVENGFEFKYGELGNAFDQLTS